MTSYSAATSASSALIMSGYSHASITTALVFVEMVTMWGIVCNAILSQFCGTR